MVELEHEWQRSSHYSPTQTQFVHTFNDWTQKTHSNLNEMALLVLLNKIETQAQWRSQKRLVICWKINIVPIVSFTFNLEFENDLIETSAFFEAKVKKFPKEKDNRVNPACL